MSASNIYLIIPKMLDFKQQYLWTYNVIQATGWNYCLYLTIAPFINNYTRESAAYVYTSASHVSIRAAAIDF